MPAGFSPFPARRRLVGDRVLVPPLSGGGFWGSAPAGRVLAGGDGCTSRGWKATTGSGGLGRAGEGRCRPKGAGLPVRSACYSPSAGFGPFGTEEPPRLGSPPLDLAVETETGMPFPCRVTVVPGLPVGLIWGARWVSGDAVGTPPDPS